MFFSWNKIILILYNLQADQDQKRAFLLKLGKVIYSLFVLYELCSLSEKKALCLSINVFSTKVLIGSTIFPCST